MENHTYFLLPGLGAREKSLRIIAKKQGWEGDKDEIRAKVLLKLYNGYGGADLKVRLPSHVLEWSSLTCPFPSFRCCVPARSQRCPTYPQIYRSMEQLLLKPETTEDQSRDSVNSVQSKDFCVRYWTRASFDTVLQAGCAFSGSVCLICGHSFTFTARPITLSCVGDHEGRDGQGCAH